MESDNSSMDGEVNPHWRESLDTKQNHVLEEDQYPAGKGPKSPPENNEHEATSAVSSDSSTQGSPRSQSPSGYNDKQPHTPPNDVAEHNGDHDGDDRLSLSPEPQDRHSLENRERDSRSRSPDNQNEGKPSSPALSEAKSPRATDNASPPPRRRTLDSPDKVPVSKSLAEDLSDVSDIESDGNDNDILNADDDRDSGDEKRKRNQINGGVTMTLAVTEEEQLDFEEEPEEREDGEEEEGECDKPPGKDTDKNGGDGGVEMKGKKEEEELEEGEVSDEGETRPEESEPRPICRFYSRGACTWGSSCRFLHPGVTDKGHYTMFDMIRPMAAPPLAHGPYHAPLRPPEHYGPPPGAVLEPRVPGGAALLPPVVRSKEDPSAPLVPGAVPTAESAWERGLRQAKEILKKSTKRKETEVDFEEKKMNLTLGQDELDKENDYYTRSASPALSPSPERILPPRKEYDHLVKPAHPHYLAPGEEYLPSHHPGALHDPYYRPLHHHDPYWPHHRPLPPPHHPYDDPHRVYARPRYGAPPPDYYPVHAGGSVPPAHPHDLAYDPASSRKTAASYSARHSKPAREVIVQRVEKPSGGSVLPRAAGPDRGDWKEDGVPGSVIPRGSSYERGGSRRESPPARRSRADEWADPWMRSKSPGGGRGGEKRRGRHSSESSYTSSSSRSTSSRSSYSSYSDSRSRSRSRSPRTAPSRKPPIQFKLSPSSRKQAPVRGKPASPPPVRMSNKLPKLPFAAASPADRRPPPPSSSGGGGGGVPPRLLATVKEALRFTSRRRGGGSSRSRSSSASSSGSSSSSSSSSEDSSSGSSSGGESSPLPRAKKPTAPPPKKPAVKKPPPPSSSSAAGGGKSAQSPPKKKPSGGSEKNSAELAKLAGQKAQIKMNLASDSKSSSSSGGGAKKRSAPADTSPNKNPPPPSKKGVPSRREELLKQLKAVEDAIARKRSKI